MKVMSKAKKSKIIFKDALPFSYALDKLPWSISFLFHKMFDFKLSFKFIYN